MGVDDYEREKRVRQSDQVSQIFGTLRSVEKKRRTGVLPDLNPNGPHEARRADEDERDIGVGSGIDGGR
jgi:hypothetical protein